ncbi:hypothetical protein GO998_25105 (plasmid) [Ralstonia syzygii]|uniref:Transmembrane protein n=1 Tax=Ralstonia syzygii TaxID=28097 RepID=A0ABX7ZN44_9RALS|nr:hypothetical protein [Ralstonia syzygii]QUP56902.1 hypothetical protein GO998_25105 [Ralstonia syzygii]
MKSKKLVALAIALFAGVVVGVIAYYRFLMSGELGEKDLYAALQAAEIDGRSVKTPGQPIFIENAYGSGYALLGLPSGNERFPYVWVALNHASSNGDVLKIPSGPSGVVSCNYVASLATRTKVDAGVLRYLKSICMNSG